MEDAPVKTEEAPASVTGGPPPKNNGKGPALDEVQRWKLEALMWRYRTFVAKANEAKRAANDRIDDAQAAQAEFLSHAKSLGIDTAKPFDWDKNGQVTYGKENPESGRSIPGAGKIGK